MVYDMYDNVLTIFIYFHTKLLCSFTKYLHKNEVQFEKHEYNLRIGKKLIFFFSREYLKKFNQFGTSIEIKIIFGSSVCKFDIKRF